MAIAKMSKKEWLYENLVLDARLSGCFRDDEPLWRNRDEIIEASIRAASEGLIDSPIRARASTKENDRSIELYNIVREINEDDAYPIVIMQKNALFKAVSAKQEGLEYLEGSLKKRALTALKRYWQQYRKICEDGQFDLFIDDFIKGVAK